MDYTDWLWIGLIPLILIGQIYYLGRKLSEPEKMMRPLPGGISQTQEQSIMRYEDWLRSVGLEYCTSFQFGSLDVVVFKQKDTPRFLSFFFHQKLTFNVESYLEDLTVLDTGTGNSGGLFPRPGAYGQSFPGLSLQEAWQRHLEGEEYLSKKFGYVWVPLAKPYEQLLPEAMRVRMQYNRAQLFWPIRVLYRYFVNRNLMKNKSIAQQFP
jgi:hypothetical protein